MNEKDNINVAIFGASGKCIALAARELQDDVIVTVFFDNDKNRTGSLIKRGYQCIDGNKIYVPFEDVIVDVPEHFYEYEFDYILIFAGSKKEIKQQLLKLKITPQKIIVYDKYISNGIVRIPMDESCNSLDDFLEEAVQKGISAKEYVEEAKRLLDTSKLLLKNKYRINVLEIFVMALEASVERKVLDYRGVRLDYRAFPINPHLFMYEAADIFIDIMDEELEEMEYIEGPYSLGGVNITEGDVVFDVGANYGLFTAIAAHKTKTGRVYAFEPIKKIRELLEHTADLYDNIEIQPYAVSDRCGKAMIDVSRSDSNQGAASIMNIRHGRMTEEIETITLDCFVKENNINKIDFIKADIEGAERLLLWGAREVLNRFAPKLAICTYHYPEDSGLLEFLIRQVNPNYIIEKAHGKLFAYVKK